MFPLIYNSRLVFQAPDSEIMTCPLTCDGEDVKFYSNENVISGLKKKAEA